MCHDISFSATTVELVTKYLPDLQWDQQSEIDFQFTDHVLSMSHRKAITLLNPDGQPKMDFFEWGLIAPYMNTPEKVKQYRIQMANARSEKLLDKAAAWYRLRSQRCLIAVDGFYEHRTIPGWKNKVPYFIHLQSEAPLLLPALYNYSPLANPETGELPGTFSILTRSANSLLQQIHNDGPNKHRMPVLMQPAEALNWLKTDLSDAELQDFVNYEIASTALSAWPVFTIRTTKARPDGHLSKHEPFEWPNLPALEMA